MSKEKQKKVREVTKGKTKECLARYLVKPWVQVLLLSIWGIFCSYVVVRIIPSVLVLLVKLGCLNESILSSNALNFVASLLSYALCLASLIALPWIVLKEKTTRDELGLRGLPTWQDIVWGVLGLIATFVVSFVVSGIAMRLLPNADWAQAQELGLENLSTNLDVLLMFLLMVVIGPIVEEVMFRGWLYGKMRARIPALPAMLIVALLFGLAHGQLNVAVVTAVMSVGMCVIREFTGTIWGGVVLHILKNCIAYIFLMRMMGGGLRF